MNFPKYDIAIGNVTHTGKIRDHNEDYMAHFDTYLGYCIIICDGMGGHSAGEIASQNAIISIQQYLQDTKNNIRDIPTALKNAIEFANYQLREMVNQNIQLKGMGTTCVLALITNGKLYFAHAGDSRLYRISGNDIEQLTKDHSVVQKMIDSGILTEAEAELSDKKNQISKAIGVFEKVEPSISDTAILLEDNDKLLLCSDGLTAHINKEIIFETVSKIADVQMAVLQLTDLAIEAGGSDNITIQLIHYTGKPNKIKGKKVFSRRKKIFATTLFASLLLIFIWAYRNLNITDREAQKVIKSNNGRDTINKNEELLKQTDTPALHKKSTVPNKKYTLQKR